MSMLITLAEAKTVLKVAGAGQDARITSMIEAISDLADRYANHAFALRTVIERHSGTAFGADAAIVRTTPLDSVVSIHDDPDGVFGASSLIAAADYYIDSKRGGIIQLSGNSTGKRTFLMGVGNVRIEYQAGYAAVPDAAKEFARLAVAYLFRQEEARAQGTASVSRDSGSVSYKPSDLPPDILIFLDSFRTPGVG